MLLDRRLLFVTGKGGVGKTTIAAALARLAARDLGKRVLVCEMDAKGALANAFETGPLSYAPRELDSGLHGMAMNTEDSLREYLRLFAKVPLLAKIGPLARAFDFVADAAPGVKEILAVGKLCYEVRERHYDLVVVDAEATGHIVAQIDAPAAIRELVHVGIVRDQTRWMSDLLDDPAVTGLVAATTPEEMPVEETLDLVERVRRTTRVAVAAVVVNRTLPEPFGTREFDVFAALSDRVADLERAAGSGASALLDAASLAVSLRRTSAEHLERLRDGLPSDVPTLYVPELYSKAAGSRTVELVATALAEELL